MRVGSRVICACLLSVATNVCFADARVTVYYLDKNYYPVARLDRLAPLSEGMRAILALYALNNGAGCDHVSEVGLQCTLTAALGFKAQCSEEHISLVRRWFPGPLPRFNTYALPEELANPRTKGALERLCYRQPNTASWQRLWEVIRIGRDNDTVTVQAAGVWVAPDGNSGKFSYMTRFRIGSRSVDLISNTEARRD